MCYIIFNHLYNCLICWFILFFTTFIYSFYFYLLVYRKHDGPERTLAATRVHPTKDRTALSGSDKVYWMRRQLAPARLAPPVSRAGTTSAVVLSSWSPNRLIVEVLILLTLDLLSGGLHCEWIVNALSISQW